MRNNITSPPPSAMRTPISRPRVLADRRLLEQALDDPTAESIHAFVEALAALDLPPASAQEAFEQAHRQYFTRSPPQAPANAG